MSIVERKENQNPETILEKRSVFPGWMGNHKVDIGCTLSAACVVALIACALFGFGIGVLLCGAAALSAGLITNFCFEKPANQNVTSPKKPPEQPNNSDLTGQDRSSLALDQKKPFTQRRPESEVNQISLTEPISPDRPELPPQNVLPSMIIPQTDKMNPVRRRNKIYYAFGMAASAVAISLFAYQTISHDAALKVKEALLSAGKSLACKNHEMLFSAGSSLSVLTAAAKEKIPELCRLIDVERFLQDNPVNLLLGL